MNTELIRKWMTHHPITITPQTRLPEAHRMMVQYNIRYLPVIKNNKLVGLVTHQDINRAQLWDVGSLNSFELNLLLERLTARHFMSHAVVTISPDATIGEAAEWMLEHQIGGLPVVENGKLIGIITETDIGLSVLQSENAV